VRTLETGAHLRRKPRDFPRCALLETGAHLRRSCAPSKADFGFGVLKICVIGEICGSRSLTTDHTDFTDKARRRSCLYPCYPRNPWSGFILDGTRQLGAHGATKRAVPSSWARLRMGEIYSFTLYRISIVTTLIISAEAESFKIKISSALLDRNSPNRDATVEKMPRSASRTRADSSRRCDRESRGDCEARSVELHSEHRSDATRLKPVRRRTRSSTDRASVFGTKTATGEAPGKSAAFRSLTLFRFGREGPTKPYLAPQTVVATTASWASSQNITNSQRARGSHVNWLFPEAVNGATGLAESSSY
jgi:hypothetical protein